MHLLVLLLLCLVPAVYPVICHIGYGQRGLRYQNEIIWQRNCRETTYCFEAVTSDIERVKPLIDYPWVSSVRLSLLALLLVRFSDRPVLTSQDPYYREYYVKSCGGYYGMPNVYHPWREIPGAKEGVLGSLKVNLTFAPTITTVGGTNEFDLRYTCRKNLCSGEHFVGIYICRSSC